MSELIFPAAAIAVTFFVVLPALTLISGGILALRRRRTRRWPDFGGHGTFALLVAPTALPLLWLSSSALHQAEPEQGAAHCLVDHAESLTCLDAALLVGLMVISAVALLALRVWRARPAVALGALVEDAPLTARIAAIAAAHPGLRGLRARVMRRAPAPVCTVGWLRPVVILDACFARDADPAMIEAALLHERAHITGLDTLRTLVAQICLSVNPAGGWLKADFERWRQAREALCDGEAVRRGGEALALAEGILRAARFRCEGHTLAGASLLCGHDAMTLKLRVALLMDEPSAPARAWGRWILLGAALAALVIPHLPGPSALAYFHFEVERLLHVFL